jgi:hypothetical protein
MGGTLGTACLVVALAGCDRQPSAFSFTLTGDVATTVRASKAADGSVDDAGHLAIDDAGWGLRIALGSLAPGSHDVPKGSGDVAIMSKSTGDVFSSAFGEGCTVWVDPHDDTNGSPVTGWFSCKSLATANGKTVTVGGGRFSTFLDDAANDPSSSSVSPPGP